MFVYNTDTAILNVIKWLSITALRIVTVTSLTCHVAYSTIKPEPFE